MYINSAITELSANPAGIKFDRLVRICDDFFGEARQKATSHRVYKMPWLGDPRVNIQENRKDTGMAKQYQVRQAIKAITKLGDEYGTLHVPGDVVA